MALSKRELRILWVTVAVAGSVLLWTQGISPAWQYYTDMQDKVEKEQKKYDSNKNILKTEKKIEADYRRIEAQFPKEDPARSPEHQFSEDVMAAAAEILPGRIPVIDQIVQHEEIKGVTQYEFLTFAIRITGELDKLSELLKGFDQKGFLIKSIVLMQSKGIDNPELDLSITLARIVKIEQDEQTVGPRRPGTVKIGGGRRVI